jgi:biotin carboxylase
MSHLLIIELPGGNDTDILEAAVRMGHSFVFLTQNLGVYKSTPDVYKWVREATECIECSSFDFDTVSELVLNSNQSRPFDALLCLVDIRLIEAADLAQLLGLRYLNSKSARLLRDKFCVRELLAEKGITQPEFLLATTNEEVCQSVDRIGLPFLIKPSDGYGSQNILIFENDMDLEFGRESLKSLLPLQSDYGLGVHSNDRLLIERYMKGILIGCDVFTDSAGQHRLLGINEKQMLTPPSFAIRGGCFIPNTGMWPDLETYLFSALDAVGFDCGASHIEVMMTPEGPRLVEINPRLVGAKIARLIGLSLGKSAHEALIRLHLGQSSWEGLQIERFQLSVTRWLMAQRNGQLKSIQLPTWNHSAIKNVELLVQPGQSVFFPFENAHRLGCLIACSTSRSEAEKIAEQYWEETELVFTEETNQQVRVA